jgi:hypothetical protein
MTRALPEGGPRTGDSGPIPVIISKVPHPLGSIRAFETQFNIYGVKYSLYEASSKKVKVPGVGASLPNGSAHFRGPRATYFGDIQFLGHYYPTHKSQPLPPNIQSFDLQ